MNNFIINYNLLIWIGLILTITSQIIVSASYSKYKKKLNNKDLTGYDVARKILDKNKLNDIIILETKGNLTDHYDPARKTIKLSTDIYHGSSIASLAVAAHECGHVIQHHENYLPLNIRSALVPAANIGSKAGIPIIILGMLLSYNYTLIQIGIWVFALSVLFQLVTLPVEFNASSRALVCLEQYGIVTNEENQMSRKVLQAAALTYVAAAAAAILQLLRLILLFGRRDDD